MSYLKPLGLILLGAALAWWGLSPRVDLQAQRADRAEQELTKAERMIDLQAGVLAEQQRQIGQVAALDRQFRQLTQDIHQNAAAHSAAIEELKRNDQVVADHLAGPVPAALGLLYARPATTDPAAYRGSALLSIGPVPAPGPAAAASD
jgi:LysB family phage lysis regulatory protein